MSKNSISDLLSIILQILFYISVFAVVYSYLIYPMLLRYLAADKSNPTIVFQESEKLPYLFIIMAVYNEEKVIDKKLQSIFETSYPTNHFQVLIGSDNSNDNTHQIIEKYQQKYNNIHLQVFGGRNGKIRIINQLVKKYESEIVKQRNAIFVMTDANVFFTEKMLFELAKYFKNEKIGLVGANVLNINIRNAGISFQEKWYIQRENVIKYREGVLWGSMMGAFGACYAMRANLFRFVPQNFIVDDFFLTMSVLKQKKIAIKELKAICYEDVSEDIFQEFKRKKRISVGNFQNLNAFSDLLLPNKKGIAFSFWSHKVLRWLSPLFIIFAFVTSLLLASQNLFFRIALYLQIGLFSVPFFEFLAQKIGLHIKILRFITYFYLMNIALLIGMFNYLKGIQSNVWQPTKRN